MVRPLHIRKPAIAISEHERSSAPRAVQKKISAYETNILSVGLNKTASRLLQKATEEVEEKTHLTNMGD